MAEEYTLKQQQVIAIAQARLRLEEQDKANADAQATNEAAYNRKTTMGSRSITYR